MNMTTAQQQAAPTSIIAFFNDMQSLETAYQILHDLEYAPVSVTMAMAEKTYQEKYAARANNHSAPQTDAQGGPDSGVGENDIPKTTKAAEGLTLGVAAGAGLGALVMLGASIVVPGIAVIGPLAASLAGAGAGATFGGLTGLLFGFGHPEDEARKYEERISAGKYMIRISPKSAEDAELIARDWKALGGEVEIHY